MAKKFGLQGVQRFFGFRQHQQGAQKFIANYGAKTNHN
jgi:hypothetical protein